MDEKPFHLVFSVPVTPRGLERPRMTIRGIHTPKKSLKAKREILLFAKLALRKAKLRATDKPVAVVIGCRFPPMTTWPKEQRDRALAKHWMVGVPDIDNIVKLVLDAINKHAYKDDRQVVLVLAAKVYHEEAGVDVIVQEVGAGASIPDIISALPQRK